MDENTDTLPPQADAKMAQGTVDTIDEAPEMSEEQTDISAAEKPPTIPENDPDQEPAVLNEEDLEDHEGTNIETRHATNDAGEQRARLMEDLGLDAVDDILLGEDEELISADNPIVARVQKTLQTHLLEKKRKLDLDIREMEEGSKKAQAKREDIGVELYNAQQRLAKLQIQLEASQENCKTIARYREETEETLEETKLHYEEEKNKYLLAVKNLDKQKLEVEKLSKTMHQVEAYKADLHSKLQITKRTTVKAEKDLMRQEDEKKKQDYFVDQLTTQLGRLQERCALYETQLVAQKRETKAARETLQEASIEMETISFEKKQLLHQWKTSLVGMQRRDEMLRAIQENIRKDSDNLEALYGEINGFKFSLKKQQNRNESLTLLLNKLESEVEFLKKQISSINEKKEKVKESYTIYTKSLLQTNSELNQVDMERSSVQADVKLVEKTTLRTIREIQKIENECMEQLQEQTSIDKGSETTKKDNFKLRAQIHEKEATIAKTQNEISNIKAETLNVKGHIANLNSRVQDYDKQLTEANNLIEKYETEIRRRNDELSKKQAEVDLLNKRFDQLCSRSTDESVGPLEATIHNLGKAVQEKEKECIELQKYWLRSQNEMVNHTKQSEKQQEEIQDLRVRNAILTRKKMHLNDRYKTEENHIKQTQRNIRKLQQDMEKINVLLSKHANVQSQLEENNLGLELEYRSKLKDAEMDFINMEKNLDETQREKSDILNGLIEAERRMMLWEKKLQLAKETRDAMDPNVGATEIKEMMIEIHRMKLRHAQILKLQEKLVTEMERSIGRREAIANKAIFSSKGSTLAGFQKSISELNRKLKTTISEIGHYDRDIEHLSESQNRLEKLIGDARHACEALAGEEYDLSESLVVLTEKRIQNSLDLTRSQKKLRRLVDLKAGKYQAIAKDPDHLERECNKQREKMTKIKSVVDAISEAYPEQTPYIRSFHDSLAELEKHVVNAV